MKTKTENLLIGRESEIEQIRTCLAVGRNVLLEGPVGVGKTHLALSVCQELGTSVFRVDGDSRYSEQKLTGWFDPPTVLQKGYTADAFVPGPLVDAMKTGGVLFINELNRLPEGVQNVLLPAIDERVISIPKIGILHAEPGFRVIATQNPKEFVATSHLSEAILDRFELVVLDYQTEAEETEIVSGRLVDAKNADPRIATLAVRLVRKTRNHKKIRRGASVRAAQAIAEITQKLMSNGDSISAAFLKAVIVALPTRIEVERDVESERSAREEMLRVILELANSVLDPAEVEELKKKT